MYLPIYTYDHPVLKQKTKRVANINDTVLALALNMLETMKHARGIGLAANQVGQSLSMTVVDISDTDGNEEVKPLVLINPAIIDAEGESTYEEGCLSLPGLREDVKRPAEIFYTYVDPTGAEIKAEADGLLARVIQHEIDHLNGIYFFERLTKIKQALVKPELNRIRKGDVETDYELAPLPPPVKKSKASAR
jgi:peptide deformylase